MLFLLVRIISSFQSYSEIFHYDATLMHASCIINSSEWYKGGSRLA